MSEEVELNIDDLKAEADDLGIKYSPNIGAKKLSEKIEDYYTSKETNVIKPEEYSSENPEVDKKTGRRTKGQKIRDAKEKATVKHIVTIIDNDQRENHLTTVVPVTCTNEFFDLGTKKVPLNTPVELEQGFIDVLREIRIPMHVKDQHSGQSKVVLRSRYTVSVEDYLKKDE